MVNRVPLCLVWPSRLLLHRKMTKEKSKEDIKYYFFSFMKISNATVTSKQNFIEKYHRLMKNLYFIFRLLFFTSNECFSHFNVQQLLSNISHFVLFSQAHLKITLKRKHSKKSISLNFIEFRILRSVLHCSNFFGARLEYPKTNEWWGLINSRGVGFFFPKNKRGGGGVYSGP